MGTTSPDAIFYPDPGYTDGVEQAVHDNADSVQAALTNRGQYRYRWADSTARGAQTGMRTDDHGYQIDTGVTYRYDGSAWVLIESPITSWAPSYTSITVGNGTVSALYSVTNGWTDAEWIFTLGSTSSVSAGVIISLPSTLASSHPIGSILTADAGVYDTSASASYPLIVNALTTTTVQLGVLNSASTYAVRAGVTGSVPITFATGDIINWRVRYRAA